MANYKTRNKWTYKIRLLLNRSSCVELIQKALGFESKASDFSEKADELRKKYDIGEKVVDLSVDDINDSVPSVGKNKEWLTEATRLDMMAAENLEKAKRLRKQSTKDNEEYCDCCEDVTDLQLDTADSDSIPMLEFELLKKIPVEEGFLTIANRVHCRALEEGNKLITDLVSEAVENGETKAYAYYESEFRPPDEVRNTMKSAARKFFADNGKNEVRKGKILEYEYSIYTINGLLEHPTAEELNYFHYFLYRTGLVEYGYSLPSGGIEYGLYFGLSPLVHIDNLEYHECHCVCLSPAIVNFLKDCLPREHVSFFDDLENEYE